MYPFLSQAISPQPGSVHELSVPARFAFSVPGAGCSREHLGWDIDCSRSRPACILIPVVAHDHRAYQVGSTVYFPRA